MTREQAINSMISHGFTVEQAGEIIKAVTLQEPVIDKIYTEIEELQRAMLYASKVEFSYIYKILDKYKAENNL